MWARAAADGTSRGGTVHQKLGWLEPLREPQMARETRGARYGSAGISDSVDWLSARSIVNYYFPRLREAAADGERIG